MLPLIIGLKVPSYYVLVKQQSNTLPSVCVSVNHICSPLLLFQMASIIALFLLQMFYGTLSEHSQPRVGSVNGKITIFPGRFQVFVTSRTNSVIATNGPG